MKLSQERIGRMEARRIPWYHFPLSRCVVVWCPHVLPPVYLHYNSWEPVTGAGFRVFAFPCVIANLSKKDFDAHGSSRTFLGGPFYLSLKNVKSCVLHMKRLTIGVPSHRYAHGC